MKHLEAIYRSMQRICEKAFSHYVKRDILALSALRLGQKTRDRRRLASIRGMVLDPYALPQGCSFNPRCDIAIAGKCHLEEPTLVVIEPGHLVQCFAVA